MSSLALSGGIPAGGRGVCADGGVGGAFAGSDPSPPLGFDVKPPVRIAPPMSVGTSIPVKLLITVPDSATTRVA